MSIDHLESWHVSPVVAKLLQSALSLLVCVVASLRLEFFIRFSALTDIE